MPVRRTSSIGARAPKRRTTASRGAKSTLDLVREGVRRFILDDASIGDFHKALRAAATKGELSPNPLSGAVFRKIVKAAINEQKRRTTQSTELQERGRHQ